jgi:hypothetical protein
VSKPGLLQYWFYQERETHADLTQVIDYFTTVDILVQWHLAQNNAEDELCDKAMLVSERFKEYSLI